MFEPALLKQIRERFHHVDHCPYQGPRIYFENAGGSLTLKSVVETNARLSAMPDNQGRDNPASEALLGIIEQGRRDMLAFLGASSGKVFIGETGTELLFRLTRAAALAAAGAAEANQAGAGSGSGNGNDMGIAQGGEILGSSFEHPATISAAKHWAKVTAMQYVSVPHDNDSGLVSADDFRQYVSANTRVVLLNQTSPLSGMSIDLKAVVKVIRAASPDCFIIVDGIQHAAHGAVSVDAYGGDCEDDGADDWAGIDAFTVSAYKVYSRFNYGIAWVSKRLSRLSHEHLDGTADDFWELGSRDASAFACFSEVVNYLDWLGAHFTDSIDRREKLLAAGQAMAEQEAYLIDALLNGIDGGQDESEDEGPGDGGGQDAAGERSGREARLSGIKDFPGVLILGGAETKHRAGVVSFVLENIDSAKIVNQLNTAGIRVHIRKNDYYSGHVLGPLGLASCVRVSLSHYNSMSEVRQFLQAMAEIVAVNQPVSAAQ